MIFGTIRIVFFVIIFAICVLLIWKSRLIHKRRWYLSALAVTIVLTTLSAFVPIENAFITFSSPTAAFEHINTGNVKLIAVSYTHLDVYKRQALIVTAVVTVVAVAVTKAVCCLLYTSRCV